MLDEKKEYEQYTHLLSAKTPNNILSGRALYSKLKGLTRVYEIIARHEIFDENGKIKSGWEDNSKKAIKSWIRKDLPRYVQTLSEKYRFEIEELLKPKEIPNYINTPEGKRKKIKVLTSKEDMLDFPLFTTVIGAYKDSANDNIAACFDTILADALEKKELKTYYLADKKDLVHQCIFEKYNSKGNIKKVTMVNKKKAGALSDTADCILKMTAAFLLAQIDQAENEKQKTVRINLTDILNWCYINKYDNYLAPQIHYFYREKKSNPEERIEIFERNRLTDNCIKFGLEDDWHENFAILTENEIPKFRKQYTDCVIYEDPGHKYKLQQRDN